MGSTEPRFERRDELAGPILPWREVRGEIGKAARRGWPGLFGASLVVAILAGAVQWLLDGHDEKAWRTVTNNGFVAPLIALVTLILLWVLIEAARAPTVLARERIAQHRKLITQHQEEISRLRTEAEARDGVAMPSPSPLEEWIRQRLHDADELARQRDARGDKWYFSAMSDWDTTNVDLMGVNKTERPALAPELVNQYRSDPRTGHTDGVYPPHDDAEHDRYYQQRKASLNQILEALRAGTNEPRESEPEIPKEHREELQALAAGLEDRLSLERRTTYAPLKADGSRPIAQSFRTHFPQLAGALDRWDGLVRELDEAREMMQQWVGAHDPAFAGAVAYYFADVIEHGGGQLPWIDAGDYLGLGSGLSMVEITAELDIDEFKRPYDDLLARAATTDEASTLQRARLRVDAANEVLRAELERIQALHVVRGRCDLCS